MFVEFLIKKFFQILCSARTGFIPMHDTNSYHLYVKSQSIASTINATFWWALQMQIEWVLRQRTLRIHYLHLGVFLWKQYIILASYKDFWKLQSFWLCAPLLTRTNINFLFRQLPAEIVICIDVCYQMECFSGDRFSFLGAGFANIFFDI